MGIGRIVINSNDTSPSMEGLYFDPSPLRIAREAMQRRRHSPLLKDMVRGFLVKRFIEEGSQKVTEKTYGKSIADPCLGWKDSEKLIRDLAAMV